jgi:hypothetical protein
MKTSLDHLPELKRAQLRAITSIFCEDQALLSLWLKRAVTASSAEEVIAPAPAP